MHGRDPAQHRRPLVLRLRLLLRLRRDRLLRRLRRPLPNCWALLGGGLRARLRANG